MVGLGRLELPTSRLSGVRSNHLSYKPFAIWPFSFSTYLRGYVDSIYVFFFSLKGGDPAAGSPTATLLRLRPSRWPYRGRQPPINRLAQRRQAEPTPMAWRAVCTRPGNVFTAACCSAITSDSNFMFSSCREQSELRQLFKIGSISRLRSSLWLPL